MVQDDARYRLYEAAALVTSMLGPSANIKDVPVIDTVPDATVSMRILAPVVVVEWIDELPPTRHCNDVDVPVPTRFPECAYHEEAAEIVNDRDVDDVNFKL